MSASSIEETKEFRPRYNADGLIPVVVTEARSGVLLMLAYMNEDALQKTLATGAAWYWSRSRQGLWRKGETSGHVQKLVELRVDCDQDALQLVVEQTGPACHTDREGCFYRVVQTESGDAHLSFIDEER